MKYQGGLKGTTKQIAAKSQFRTEHCPEAATINNLALTALFHARRSSTKDDYILLNTQLCHFVQKLKALTVLQACETIRHTF